MTNTGYSSPMRRICSVYRSPKKDEMYLYVDKQQGLSEVPEALLDRFGEPVLVMTLLLSKDKPLARANVEKVLSDITEKGFYLQMPPARDSYMLDLYKAPTEAKY